MLVSAEGFLEVGNSPTHNSPGPKRYACPLGNEDALKAAEAKSLNDGGKQ
jgi:hypothetical protein